MTGRRVLLMWAVLVCGTPAAAQDCAPQRWVAFGNAVYDAGLWGGLGGMQQIVAALPKVPAGMIAEVREAGVISRDGRPLEWKIQHEALFQDGTSPHYVPIATTPGAANTGTPVLAWTGQLFMEAGETLDFRVTAPTDFGGGGISLKGWIYPRACLARRMGLEAAGSVTAPPTVDYSAFTAALQTAASALQGVASHAP